MPHIYNWCPQPASTHTLPSVEKRIDTSTLDRGVYQFGENTNGGGAHAWSTMNDSCVSLRLASEFNNE
jgi:hypothetical protein